MGICLYVQENACVYYFYMIIVQQIAMQMMHYAQAYHFNIIRCYKSNWCINFHRK